MKRLTRHEAQQRIAAVCPSLLIHYSHPDEEAVRIRHAVRNQTLRLLPAEEDAVLEALAGYAAHVAFEEGRAFELAAVERARMAAWGGEPTIAGCEALSRFGATLRYGVHHAESVSVERPRWDVPMEEVEVECDD